MGEEDPIINIDWESRISNNVWGACGVIQYVTVMTRAQRRSHFLIKPEKGGVAEAAFAANSTFVFFVEKRMQINNISQREAYEAVLLNEE